MLSKNYVIFSDNGTLIDISREVNTITAGSRVFNYTTAEDYLYIGGDMPFNHRYFQLTSAVNAVDATCSVEVWDGSAWNAVAYTLDETQSTTGKSLSGNGLISWVPDRNKSWGLEQTTENIAALSTLKIYDMYWVRLSWSATLTNTTALFYIGHKFSSDADLAERYPDLIRTDVLDAFTTSKTTWNTQAVLAAEEIVQDLRRRRIVKSRNQILNVDQFNNASVHKTAQIIYNSFGAGMETARSNARSEYKTAMDLMVFDVDTTGDARLDQIEKTHCPLIIRR